MEDLCREATDPIVPPGYGAIVVTELPDIGIENLIYILDNGGEIAVYLWDGEEYVPVSGCTFTEADEGKVVQSGALVSQSSQTVTENGTYDTTLKNEVVVDVHGGSLELIVDSTSTEAATIVKATIPEGKQNEDYYKVEIDAEFNGTEYPYWGINDTYSSYITAKARNTPFSFFGAIVKRSVMSNGDATSSVSLLMPEKTVETSYPAESIEIKSYYENGIKAGCRIRVWRIAQ